MTRWWWKIDARWHRLLLRLGIRQPVVHRRALVERGADHDHWCRLSGHDWTHAPAVCPLPDVAHCGERCDVDLECCDRG